MLGQSSKLGIGAGARQDLGIARSDHASALALERMADNRRPAAPGARVDEIVDEIHELVRESYGNLLAHPMMVAKWEQRICTKSIFRRSRLPPTPLIP